MTSVAEWARTTYRSDGPRVRDVAAVAFGLVLTLLAAKTPWSFQPRWVIVVAGCVGGAALWWRRRWPLGVTLVGVVAFVLSGNPWPPAVGLSTFASQRRDATLVALTLVAGIGFGLPVMFDLDRFDLPALVAGLAEAGFVAAVGAFLGIRDELLASLRDRAARAEAEERARIAREMHDVLAHQVSLIALHAGALEVNPRVGPARVEEVAGLIRTTACQALEELRLVLGVLRDTAGADDLDLAPQRRAGDIGRLVDASRAARVPAELCDELPDDAELPDPVSRAVYRIVQEGLTNVHKHALGAPTVVVLRGDPDTGVTVSVANGRSDGAGPRFPGSGTGLVGLEERTRVLGGTLRSGPEPDGGWRLEAWLPWSSTAGAVLP